MTCFNIKSKYRIFGASLSGWTLHVEIFKMHKIVVEKISLLDLRNRSLLLHMDIVLILILHNHVEMQKKTTTE